MYILPPFDFGQSNYIRAFNRQQKKNKEVLNSINISCQVIYVVKDSINSFKLSVRGEINECSADLSQTGNSLQYIYHLLSPDRGIT